MQYRNSPGTVAAFLCIFPTSTCFKNIQTAVLRWYKKEIAPPIAFETCFHYHQEPQPYINVHTNDCRFPKEIASTPRVEHELIL